MSDIDRLINAAWNEAIEEAAKVVDDRAKKYLPGGPVDMKLVCRDAASAIRALKRA